MVLRQKTVALPGVPNYGFGNLQNTDETTIWVTTPGQSYSGSAVAASADTLYKTVMPVSKQMTVTRLGCRVTSAAASSVARIGLRPYRQTAGAGFGTFGALIVDGGEFSVASTGLKTVTISQVLNPGLYCLEFVSDGAPSLTGIPLVNGPPPVFGLQESGGFLNPVPMVTRAFTYGALASAADTNTQSIFTTGLMWLGAR